MPNNIVETSFHVRYAETDQMGIVHHASYVVWLEEGRSHWIRSRGNSVIQLEKEGLRIPVSDVQIRYLNSARYDQLVTVRCWVDNVRSRQMQFSYEIIDPSTGTIFVKATTRHVCVDEKGVVTKFPEKWRTFLSQGLTA
ncbi:MAG: acyl-CoA thioesterase [Chloroflexota bacterium]